MELKWTDMLNLAHEYAIKKSGCNKVAVGAVVTQKGICSFGANQAIPDLCKMRGCLRKEKYGDDDKTHRGPEDCRAIHAEIDAICHAGIILDGATMYITRYPCEACARAIVAAGIKRVIYGRRQCTTAETDAIFEYGKVDVTHCYEWTAPDAEN